MVYFCIALNAVRKKMLTASKNASGQFYISIKESENARERFIYLHSSIISVDIIDDVTFIVNTRYSGSMLYTIENEEVSSPTPVRSVRVAPALSAGPASRAA